MAKEYAEKVTMKVLKIARKSNSGDVVQDIKEGYIHFDVMLQVNDKKVLFEKRIRLDKPDRMLNKFIEKIIPLAEEQYKDMTYYVADKQAPETVSELENEEELRDRMTAVFEEVAQFVKTGNIAVLGTKSVEF